LTAGFLVFITLGGSAGACSSMRPETILVPLDTARYPVEVFARVNAFAQRPGVTVVLLHVVNLNLAAPDRRVDQELCREAQWHLGRLAATYVQPGPAIVTRVRMGKPAEEILAEAREQDASLIIVPAFASSWRRRRGLWGWLWAALCPGVVGKLIRFAQCPVLVVHAETVLDCRRQWWRGEEEIKAALEYLHANPRTSHLPARAPEASPVPSDQEVRRAA
jgi:nucleotide-binding universal stress UspA family protein